MCADSSPRRRGPAADFRLPCPSRRLRRPRGEALVPATGVGYLLHGGESPRGPAKLASAFPRLRNVTLLALIS